jgi:predicted anti-sigma-YlaC factor YlaD
MIDCRAARLQFSGYLDGAVSGRVMQNISAHLNVCQECNSEFAAMRETQRLLSALGPAKVPEDLALRIRVAVSQENAQQSAWNRARLQSRWDNAIAPFLMQAGAGLASAVLLLGIVILGIGAFAAPSTVLANDEPIKFHTGPHLLYVAASASPDISLLNEVVVQAAINTQGQVYDFRIVSGPDTPEVRAAVASRLLLSVFEPARMFGQPVNGQAILSFAGMDITA